ASDDGDIRAELRRLAVRVAALEAARAPRATAAALDPETFWALTGLREQLAAEPDGPSSVVMLLGDVTLPTGEPVSWQQSVDTDGLLESEWGDRAAAFAALGHPVRLELLRRILTGTR